MRQRRSRIRGSYDPIVFQTETGTKERRSTMPTRIDQIIKLIQEEASQLPGHKKYNSKLLLVSLEIQTRLSDFLKGVRDDERVHAIKKGGE